MAGERLLVTGATGFVGSAVMRHWAEHHPEVEAWGASDRPCPEWCDPSRYRRLDLRDEASVTALVRDSRPTAVIHLASVISGADLETYLSVNVLGTARLYDALAGVSAPGTQAAGGATDGPADAPVVVQVGSAAMYGRLRENELPVTEEQPFRPVTDYAVSKIAQEYASVAAGYSSGLRIIRARVFNLLGPGQPGHLVPMTFVNQLAAVKDGRAEAVKAGLTSARRDFVDVRDAARAFDLLLESGTPGAAYNVASGDDVSVEEVIETLMEVAGVRAAVEVDEDRLRPVDVPVVRADISRIREDTGWEPVTGLCESLEDMWRETR